MIDVFDDKGPIDYFNSEIVLQPSISKTANKWNGCSKYVVKP